MSNGNTMLIVCRCFSSCSWLDLFISKSADIENYYIGGFCAKNTYAGVVNAVKYLEIHL